MATPRASRNLARGATPPPPSALRGGHTPPRARPSTHGNSRSCRKSIPAPASSWAASCGVTPSTASAHAAQMGASHARVTAMAGSPQQHARVTSGDTSAGAASFPPVFFSRFTIWRFFPLEAQTVIFLERRAVPGVAGSELEVFFVAVMFCPFPGPESARGAPSMPQAAEMAKTGPLPASGAPGPERWPPHRNAQKMALRHSRSEPSKPRKRPSSAGLSTGGARARLFPRERGGRGDRYVNRARTLPRAPGKVHVASGATTSSSSSESLSSTQRSGRELAGPSSARARDGSPRDPRHEPKRHEPKR